jgi:pimeloyl-ACP methyl ester carboxylesterase
MIRALFHATRIPNASAPHDTLHLKVYYPAKPTGSDSERMSGIMPADAQFAPMPVVIFLNGINVGVESYHWLAMGLAERGIATVLYTHIAETLPGVVGLTPSIDLSRVKPDTYGTAPTCPAIAPILQALAGHCTSRSSPLHNMLDMQTVILGGHSAGGTVALQNGQFFDEVKGMFSYAGHTMASTMLGYAPGTILPIGAKPTLLLQGDRDGVIAASRMRYGTHEQSQDPVALTFDQAVQASGYSYDILLEGANHFSVAHPYDESTGRSFLDMPEIGDGHRDTILNLISGFILGNVMNVLDKKQHFDSILHKPGIKTRHK